MEEQQASSTNKGEFFSVSMQALDAMARQGGSAEDVLAYLVLARHTKGRGAGAGVWTAAGASAIANKAVKVVSKDTILLVAH